MSVSSIFDDVHDEDEGLFAAPQAVTKSKRSAAAAMHVPAGKPADTPQNNSSRSSRTVTPELLPVDNPDDPFQTGFVNNPGLARLLSDT
jgi:hypothetical protein